MNQVPEEPALFSEKVLNLVAIMSKDLLGLRGQVLEKHQKVPPNMFFWDCFLSELMSLNSSRSSS